jgi:hypothetical protein
MTWTITNNAFSNLNEIGATFKNHQSFNLISRYPRDQIQVPIHILLLTVAELSSFGAAHVT